MTTVTERNRRYYPGAKPYDAACLIAHDLRVTRGGRFCQGWIKAGFTLLEKRGLVELVRGEYQPGPDFFAWAEGNAGITSEVALAKTRAIKMGVRLEEARKVRKYDCLSDQELAKAALDDWRGCERVGTVTPPRLRGYQPPDIDFYKTPDSDGLVCITEFRRGWKHTDFSDLASAEAAIANGWRA